MESVSRDLSRFLQDQQESILQDWERADRRLDSAKDLPWKELRDSMPIILSELAQLADNAASGYQQVEFPRALPRTHAEQRANYQFSLNEISREYAILRKVVLTQLYQYFNEGGSEEKREVPLGDVLFLNSALDEIITQAVEAYSEVVNAEMRKAECRYRRICDSGMVGVLEHRRDGTIVSANEAFLDTVKASPDDIHHQTLDIFSIIPPENYQEAKQAIDQLQHTGVMLPVEKQYVRTDGTRADVLVSAASLDSDGELDLALVLDISDRKQLEAEQARQREFEQQLIGIVSHDLRNPLGAITLGVSLLQRRQDLDTRTTNVVNSIGNSAHRAQRMILDLLDFTRARLSGRIPVDRVPADLHEVSTQLVDELRLAYPDRHIVLEQHGSAQGQWDPDRVAQILTNLTSNALAYSTDNSTVYIRVMGKDERVLLQVANQGKPIPEDMLPYLFEPLQRGHSEGNNQSRSLGLGLFIVQQLVNAHDGKISVVSNVEEGTVFSVEMPRQPKS